jgi:hypothetical protein
MLKCKSSEHDSLNSRAGGTSRLTSCLALTVFCSLDGNGEAKKLKATQEMQSEQQGQNTYSFCIHEGGFWIVKTTETIRIAPRVKRIVVGKLELQKLRRSPELVCVEPAQLPFEGVLAARDSLE